MQDLKGVVTLINKNIVLYPMKMVPHFKDYLWGGQTPKKI